MVEQNVVTICINGVRIFGCVGINSSAVLSVQDCWATYNKYKATEQLFCGIDGKPIWTFNGIIIDTPQAWFLAVMSS